MIANLTRKDLLKYSIFFILAVVLIVFAAAMTYLVFEDRKMMGLIYPNTYVDNLNVGGKTKEEAAALLNKKYQPITNVNIHIIYNKEPIATFSAEQLTLQRNIRETVDHAYVIGRTTHVPSRLYQKAVTIFRLQNFYFTSHVIYDKADIRDFIHGVEEAYNRPAKNALFAFEEGKVVSFKPDEKGLKINSDQFIKDFEKKLNELNNKIENKQVPLSHTIIDPEITLAEANDMGIEELIGEGHSDYTHSIPSRVHNVILAATKFNGVIVQKDKEFSFGAIIGDISARTGYQQAYVINNGRTVLGDGGGVCQVSTTLFRAALNTGLPITERHAHAYRVGYYENDSKPGFDATIYTPTVDFRFKNDTPGAILIQTEVDKENNLLHFKFYGKKDNRRVELSDAIVWDVVGPPPPIYQDDPTLKRGVVNQVDFAAGGAKSKFTYKVYKGNDVAIDTEFVSVYRPWAAVFLVGTQD